MTCSLTVVFLNAPAGYPWQVALPQSLLPFRRPQPLSGWGRVLSMTQFTQANPE